MNLIDLNQVRSQKYLIVFKALLIILALTPIFYASFRLLGIANGQVTFIASDYRFLMQPIIFIIQGACTFLFCIYWTLQLSTGFKSMKKIPSIKTAVLVFTLGFTSGVDNIWLLLTTTVPELESELLFNIKIIHSLTLIGCIIYGYFNFFIGKHIAYENWLFRSFSLALITGSYLLLNTMFHVLSLEFPNYTNALIFVIAWVTHLMITEWLIEKRQVKRMKKSQFGSVLMSQ